MERGGMSRKRQAAQPQRRHPAMKQLCIAPTASTRRFFRRRPRLIAHPVVRRGSPLDGRCCYVAMMERRCFRGMSLDYRGDPRLEAGAVRFEADGLLVVKDG